MAFPGGSRVSLRRGISTIPFFDHRPTHGTRPRQPGPDRSGRPFLTANAAANATPKKLIANSAVQIRNAFESESNRKPAVIPQPVTMAPHAMNKPRSRVTDKILLARGISDPSKVARVASPATAPRKAELTDGLGYQSQSEHAREGTVRFAGKRQAPSPSLKDVRQPTQPNH